jgi:hypothetical protein
MLLAVDCGRLVADQRNCIENSKKQATNTTDQQCVPVEMNYRYPSIPQQKQQHALSIQDNCKSMSKEASQHRYNMNRRQRLNRYDSTHWCMSPNNNIQKKVV